MIKNFIKGFTIGYSTILVLATGNIMAILFFLMLDYIIWRL